EPKMGLLNYVISSWDPEGRDVVFVPVALNYDRVLEDYILIAAGKRGDRRFGANISVVSKFMMNQLWLRLTGRYTKFGYAAASFGRPLSLTTFNKRRGKLTTENVAKELITRIGQVVPVLPVPLLASVLVEQGSMPEDQLKAAIVAKMDRFEEGHVHVPREDAEYAAEIGIANLRRRALIEDGPDGVQISEKGRDVVPYYASTLEHLKTRDA
ncbi:MAG: glycerol-3-phosphate acyltransferase, partial [Planktomarina sp.]